MKRIVILLPLYCHVNVSIYTREAFGMSISGDIFQKKKT